MARPVPWQDVYKRQAVEKKSTWRLWGMVVVGCIPAAILGFAFDDWVSEHFYNKVVVASMLILYGVCLLYTSRVLWNSYLS